MWSQTAEGAQEFASRVVDLLTNPASARRKGLEGRARVMAAHNWDQSLGLLLNLVGESEGSGTGTSKCALLPGLNLFDLMIRTKTPSTAQKTILMLLTNAYDPDPRVRQEALSLIRMGYRVRLLAWDRDRKSPPSECMEGVEVERVFLSSSHGRGSTQIFFYALLYLRMLWRCLRTPFDAVHCHDLDTLPLGFLVGKLKRKPVVYDAHESFPDMLEGSVHQAIRRALVKLEDFLIRRTDLLITVGEKLRQFFAQRGARRSVVVGNWKRLEEFSRTELENLATRGRLRIPPEALVVVCITQLLKDRKIEELFDAVAECPDVYVIVAGRGVLESMVRDASRANPRILFVGLISGKADCRLYLRGRCDLLWVRSGEPECPLQRA